MAAMKPRTGEGPLEVVKETKGYIVRIPTEGGGRSVFQLDVTEASALRDALLAVLPVAE